MASVRLTAEDAIMKSMGYGAMRAVCRSIYHLLDRALVDG